MKDGLNPEEWAGHDLPQKYRSQLPWFNEILWDAQTHEYKDFKFRIIRMTWGVWNGYVILPKGHIFHGKTMEDRQISDLTVHGGVTYTDSGGGEWSKEDDWIIGFDTNHIYDFSPDSTIRDFNIFLEGCKNYKNHEYVFQEAKKLIDSILFTTKYYS
tara:strand:- start:585 stop:1055 length:471 start_codon:yes stop_codon:yes gene_type:complete